MVQKCESPIRVYKYPLDMVMKDSHIEEIQKFAKEYVEEIISEATVLASEREATFHSEKAVAPLNNPVTSSKSGQQSNIAPQNHAPDIHIDLIGARSPTPEEETFPWVEEAQRDQRTEQIRQDKEKEEDSKRETRFIQDDGDKINQQQSESNDQQTDQKSSKVIEDIKDSHMEEIQQFAKEYVKEIISKATILASEREATFHSLHSEISQNLMQKNCNLSWLERLRQMFRRFIGRACLCKTKHDSIHSFKQS